jgi:AraC family transcriptional regulator of adaptative response/methylated-DNA-[protein]-cysteine methyltransferase
MTESTVSRAPYPIIEQALLYLDANVKKRPSLAEVAASVGMSEFHFQRLFTRWAGVSPKRFLQFQTLAHAKQLLRESRSLLDATYEAGLSSPGRLHDLFVSVDAVTPGEFKRGGEGLDIAYGVHETPFGDCLIAVTGRGVCALWFLAESGFEGALERLRAQWPEARVSEDPSLTAAYAERIFGGAPARAGAPPLRLFLRGTNFQLKVWEALLRIPPGGVTTYEEIAEAIGAPGASRAVGAAVGANPVAYLIPCHRVIRKTGAFGGYRWGVARKRAMLGWEAARTAGGEAAD